MMDRQDRLWFGENRADKVGMFDTKTRAFQEWAPASGAFTEYLMPGYTNVRHSGH